MVDKSKKISVIIPIYNVEKYVAKCITSVISQMDNSVEMILIDDGSTDRSAEVCKQIIYNKDIDVLFLTQENMGLSATRNRGIKEAQGEYVLFLDSDDELAPDAISILKEKIEEISNVDLFYFDAKVVDEVGDGKKRNTYNRKNWVPACTVMRGVDYFRDYYTDILIVSACLCLIKKKVIIENNIYFDEGKLYEDNAFSFNILLSAKRVFYLPFDLYIRRYREDSITVREIKEKDIEDICFVISRFLEKKEFIISIGDLKVCNAYLSLIYKIFEWGYKKMLNEGWNLDCYQQLINSICFDFEDWPEVFRSISFYYFKFLIESKRKNIELSKIEYLKNRIRTKLIDLFETIDTSKRIGVYGQGKHTDILKATYKSLMGKDLAISYYIDTFQTGGNSSEGIKIVNICDAKNYIDIIIISSYYYRLDMLNYCEKYVKNKEIIDLYITEKMNLFDIEI